MSTSLLLADDSATIAKILSMALHSEPYEIRSVLTADEAVKALYANPPSYFLIDLTLPGKNGYEFAQMIRADAKFANTRVVLLSSAFDPVDPEKFQSSGADAVIVKPFDPAELRAKLRQLGELPPKRAPKVEKTETPPETPAISEALLAASMPEGDANSILSSLLGEEPSASPDTPPPPPKTESPEPTSPTIQLDTADVAPPFQPSETVLDFTAALQSETAMIEAPPPSSTSIPMPESNEDVLGALLGTKEEELPELPPASAPLTPEAQALSEFFEKELTKNVELPPPAPPVDPVNAPLSKNAEALAAFFAAEVEQKQAIAAAAPSAQEEDPFDASLDSIEWATPPEESLNAWSSNAQPVSPTRAEAKAKGATAPTGASLGGAPMFDTGGSNFRFAEDYIHRITRSFTGALDESVPARHSVQGTEKHVFAKSSSDSTPHSPPPAAGGGAWNAEELQKVEQLVRDEVQMVVREVVEKIAWEVIPELAENLIKKELEKVLKQMEG